MKRVSKAKRFSFLQVKLNDAGDSIDGIEWVQVLRTGTFLHPRAPNGEFEITAGDLVRVVSNFKNNVRRLATNEVPFDYGHDVAGPASGWGNDLEIRGEFDEQLWAKTKWTPKASKNILDREYRFISADIDFEYIDNESGVNHGPVLLGAALVNRPHIKDMEIVFSEHTNDDNEKGATKMAGLTPEQMLAKITELEGILRDMRSQMQAKDEQLGEVKPKAAKVEGLEKSVTDLTTKLKASEEKVKKTEEDVTKAKKKARFDEYVKAGKIAPSKEESFMKMDLKLAEDLFKDAKVVNLNDSGHGGTGGNKGDGKGTPAEIVEKRAAKLMEDNKSLTLGEAYSEVLGADKKLDEQYQENCG